MDLGHPLGSITSPLVARALEVLSGTTRQMTGREIGRIIGEGSANGVWKALNRLEEQGLVVADHRSRATCYVANQSTWRGRPSKALYSFAGPTFGGTRMLAVPRGLARYAVLARNGARPRH